MRQIGVGQQGFLGRVKCDSRLTSPNFPVLQCPANPLWAARGGSCLQHAGIATNKIENCQQTSPGSNGECEIRRKIAVVRWGLPKAATVRTPNKKGHLVGEWGRHRPENGEHFVRTNGVLEGE